MTSSLAKSKQIIGAHLQTLLCTIFLFFDVPQYSNRFDYIKDIRPAILTTKKSLHIIFKNELIILMLTTSVLQDTVVTKSQERVTPVLM